MYGYYQQFAQFFNKPVKNPVTVHDWAHSGNPNGVPAMLQTRGPQPNERGFINSVGGSQNPGFRLNIGYMSDPIGASNRLSPRGPGVPGFSPAKTVGSPVATPVFGGKVPVRTHPIFGPVQGPPSSPISNNPKVFDPGNGVTRFRVPGFGWFPGTVTDSISTGSVQVHNNLSHHVI